MSDLVKASLLVSAAIFLAGVFPEAAGAVMVTGTIADAQTTAGIGSAEIILLTPTEALLTNRRQGQSQGFRRVATAKSNPSGAFVLNSGDLSGTAIRIEAWGYYPLLEQLTADDSPLSIKLQSRIDVKPEAKAAAVAALIEMREKIEKNTGLIKVRRKLEKLAAKHPQSCFVHNMLGALFLRLREEALAEKHLTEAVSLNPRDPGPFINLAALYIQQADFARAAAAANEAMALDGTSAKANFLLGQARYHQVNLPQAQTDLLRAHDLDPRLTPDTLIYLGNIQLIEKRPEDALVFYLRALNDFPGIANRTVLETTISEIRQGKYSK